MFARLKHMLGPLAKHFWWGEEGVRYLVALEKKMVKLMVGGMATKLPFLVLFWFWPRNATNLLADVGP